MVDLTPIVLNEYLEYELEEILEKAWNDIFWKEGKFEVLETKDFDYGPADFGTEFWFMYDTKDPEIGLDFGLTYSLEEAMGISGTMEGINKIKIHARWWAEYLYFDILEINDRKVFIKYNDGSVKNPAEFELEVDE